MVEGPIQAVSDCQDGGEIHGGAEWCKTWVPSLGAKSQISNAGSVPISLILYIYIYTYPMEGLAEASPTTASNPDPSEATPALRALWLL